MSPYRPAPRRAGRAPTRSRFVVLTTGLAALLAACARSVAPGATAASTTATGSGARAATPPAAASPVEPRDGAATAHAAATSARRGAVVVRTPSGVELTLPPPFATRSNDAPPLFIDRPASAQPTPAPGYRVSLFAHVSPDARWMTFAPDGALLVSDHFEGTVSVLRPRSGPGAAAPLRVRDRVRFASGLSQPFGLAVHPRGYLYVACTDRVVRFPYAPGRDEPTGPAETVARLPGRGYHQHWTRNVVVAPEGDRIFVTVGSETNVDAESDARRGAISVYDLDGANHRVFAGGLRNPVGLAFEPHTRALFTVVNERDGLGDELVPDYLTSVREGAFYGWPYAYFGANEDPRRAGERPDLVASTVVPDLPLGAHVAPLGLAFVTRPGLGPGTEGDAVVALHGSWNRVPPSGYRVVRVRFREGRPTGEVSDLLTGFLVPGPSAWGRPTAVAQGPDGALYVLDDLADVIWRVSYTEGGVAPTPGPAAAGAGGSRATGGA